MTEFDVHTFTFRGRSYRLFRRRGDETAPFYFRIQPPRRHGGRPRPRRMVCTRQHREDLAVKFAKAEIARIVDGPPSSAPREIVTVAEVTTRILAAKKADGASELHLLDIERRLSRFGVDFAERPISSFTTPELNDWLRGLVVRQRGLDNEGATVAPVTRNKFRAILSLFFAFAVEEELADSNPATSCKRAKEKSEPIVVPSPQQILQLLKHATAEILPYYAIRALAGLRRSEVERLTWGHVDVNSRLIEVTDPKAGAPRVVEMPECLAAWLGPTTRGSGPVAPSHDSISAHQRDAHEAVDGWERWPDKSLRHAWFSYHVAHHENAPYTALQGGHVRPQLLFRKYRGIRTLDGQRITKDLADSYFRIYPDGIREETAAREPRKIINFG